MQDRTPNMDKELPDNPNRKHFLYLVNIIFLCCLTLVSVGITLFLIFSPRIGGGKGKMKLYSDGQIEEIRAETAEEILGEIQASRQSGKSEIQTLRDVFRDRIVIASGGGFYFYPIEEDVPENTYEQGSIRRSGSGVEYDGESSGVRFAQGVFISDDNGRIDWDRLAESETREVALSVGSIMKKGFVADTQFDRNLRKALEKSVPVLFCIQIEGTGDEQAASDAVYALRQAVDEFLGQGGETLPDPEILLRLDEESLEDLDSEGRKKRAAVLEKLCVLAQDEGLETIAGAGLFGSMDGLSPEVLAEHDLWLIQYENTVYYPYDFSFWEYSDQGQTEGVPGRSVLYVRVQNDDRTEEDP